MEKPKKVEPQLNNQAPQPDESELDEAALDEVSGGTKKSTGGSNFFTALAQAWGKALDKQADNR